MKLTNTIQLYRGRRTFPVFRGNDELEFLNQWMSEEVPEDTTVAAVSIPLTLPEIIDDCGRCSHVYEKKQSIGSGSNGVMIVLNAPQLISSDEKKMYKSESVDLLKKIVSAMKIDIRDSYVTNLIKCESSDPLQKPSQMLSECIRIFNTEINRINPKIVVVMGDMLPLQKLIRDYHSINWFNIHHPITLIKNSELKRPAWNTLKLVIDKLQELKLQL